MNIEVRNIDGNSLKEVILETSETTITTSTLNTDEQESLAVEFLEAAYDLVLHDEVKANIMAAVDIAQSMLKAISSGDITKLKDLN